MVAHCGLDHCVQYGSAAVIMRTSFQSNRRTAILRPADTSACQPLFTALSILKRESISVISLAREGIGDYK